MKDLMDTNLFRGRDNCCKGGQPQGVLGGQKRLSVARETSRQGENSSYQPSF